MGIPVAPASGFRDFLPEECSRRSRAVEAISRVYRSFGFSQIATPAAEDLAVLTGKGGGENEKLIFKILKRGEKLEEARRGGELADLGLRFDLTLPLARYYSRFAGQLPQPFKAFHIGPVWRAERAQKGRYREFFQCDADIIGSENPYCEIEVIQAITAAFSTLGVQAVAHINDRRLLTAALRQAGVGPAQQGPACVLLDKQDKIERPKLLEELELLIGSEPTKTLETWLLRESPDIDALRRASPDVFAGVSGIVRTLGEISGNPAAFRFSPSLVRGFDYYTGPVFEFRHPHLPASLGGGGRYDRLTETFGGAAVPACGGSIGFERLMLLLEQSPDAGKKSGPHVCVTVFSEELRPRSLVLGAQLRGLGLDVDVYPGSGKLAAQFKYADRRESRFVVVLGPEEVAAGRIKIKDLSSGQERLESPEGLARFLSEALK